MRKYWILIQEMDAFGHFAAYVVPVGAYENLASILKRYPDIMAANICPTRKEARTQAQILNDQWHYRGLYRWDHMEDGTTPAPF